MQDIVMNTFVTNAAVHIVEYLVWKAYDQCHYNSFPLETHFVATNINTEDRKYMNDSNLSVQYS